MHDGRIDIPEMQEETLGPELQLLCSHKLQPTHHPATEAMPAK